MTPALRRIQKDRTIAHVAPLAWFMLSIFLLGLLGSAVEWKHPDAVWWKRWPDTWILPLQTISTAFVVAFFWKNFDFRTTRKALVIGAIMGAVGIGFWLLPTLSHQWLGLTENPESGPLKWLGIHDRKEGFDPAELESLWWERIWIALRFFRAVVIVAIVEEVLWRGFLMRYLLKPDGNYWKVPFGKPSLLTYAVVTIAFMIAHPPVDYAGAFIYGSLTYLTAVWTKNLLACVVMHGVANFIMCWFALETARYGLL